jgi:hypothetical protein
MHRRPLDLFYQAEIRSGMLESDPVQSVVGHQIAPTPVTTPPILFGPVLKCLAGAGPTQTVTQGGVIYVPRPMIQIAKLDPARVFRHTHKSASALGGGQSHHHGRTAHPASS